MLWSVEEGAELVLGLEEASWSTPGDALGSRVTHQMSNVAH